MPEDHQDQSNNNIPISTGVVGYGYAGRRFHVPLVLLESGLKLERVVSSDAAKRNEIQTRLGCPTYERFEDLLTDPAIELVVLATPNALHASQAIAALNAGKHVVVDKPMALDVRQGREMIAAAESNHRRLAVFHNRRWDGDYLSLRAVIASGQLGKLQWLEMAWQKPGLPRTWRRSADEGGGRLVDLGSHMIDQVLHLMGKMPRHVHARIHRQLPGADIDSHAMVVMGFDQDATVIVDTTSQTWHPKPRILAMGDKGTFVKFGADPQEASLAEGTLHGIEEKPENQGRLCSEHGVTIGPVIRGDWSWFYRQMAAAIGEGAAVPVSGEEGLRVLQILEAAFESERTGKVVDIQA